MKRHYNQPVIQIVAIAQGNSLLSDSIVTEMTNNLPEGDKVIPGGGTNSEGARSRRFDFFDD